MPDREEPGLEAAYALETPDDNRRLYRSWAATYDADFAEASGYRLPAAVADAWLAAGGTGPVLDVGCGTGLVADHLPGTTVVDGLDISPEMLAVAARKGRYRALIEADLTRPLALADVAYAGLISAGTFTHGHVGPEALHELLRIAAPGAVFAIGANAAYMEKTGFREVVEGLHGAGTITSPAFRSERIYEAGASAPEGHGDDMGAVIVFRRA